MFRNILLRNSFEWFFVRPVKFLNGMLHVRWKLTKLLNPSLRVFESRQNWKGRILSFRVELTRFPKFLLRLEILTRATKRHGINYFVETRLSRLTDLSRHWKLHRLIRRSTMQTCSLSFSGSLLLFRREIDKLCIQLFMLGGHNRARWLTRSWHALQVLLPLPISFANPRWVPSTRVARVAILNLLARCR